MLIILKTKIKKNTYKLGSTQNNLKLTLKVTMIYILYCFRK